MRVEANTPPIGVESPSMLKRIARTVTKLLAASKKEISRKEEIPAEYQEYDPRLELASIDEIKNDHFMRYWYTQGRF